MEEKLKNSNLPSEEQKELLKSLDKEMAAEQDELNNMLNLEQEENIEQLTKVSYMLCLLEYDTRGHLSSCYVY